MAMTWALFYLICFVFGFTSSALWLLTGLGHLHLPIKWHLPHSGLQGPHGMLQRGTAGGVHSGVLHGSGAAHPPVGGTGSASPVATAKVDAHLGAISPINSFTLMAFLTWFGGTGYLLTQYSRLWFALA